MIRRGFRSLRRFVRRLAVMRTVDDALRGLSDVEERSRRIQKESLQKVDDAIVRVERLNRMLERKLDEHAA